MPLAKLNMAKLILFNRKRSGEVERMSVSQYKKGLLKDLGPVEEELIQHLTAFEKELIEKLQHVEIKGKRGRKVPILLTEKMVQSLEHMLLSHHLPKTLWPPLAR